MSTTAPAQKVEHFVINDGPNADLTVDAYKYAYAPGGDFRVSFSNIGHNRVVSHRAQVVGLEYESGARGMFLIKVNIPGYKTSKGFYNANRREGFIDLVPND